MNEEEDKTDNPNGLKGKEIETEILGIKCIHDNHSFKKLAAVICRDTKLSNEDEVIDLTGAKRTMKITLPNKEVENSYRKYMLVSMSEDVNIEVFVLKEFLQDRLGLVFKPRVSE